jgi:hypothetical protein
MMANPGFHLAELNVGRLQAPTDDPRVAGFAAALDRGNGLGKMHSGMWRAPAGHRPTLDEALERLAELQANGDTDRAFGWSHLTEASAWKTHGFARMAAE